VLLFTCNTEGLVWYQVWWVKTSLVMCRNDIVIKGGGRENVWNDNISDQVMCYLI
jgi:hypothetical protein